MKYSLFPRLAEILRMRRIGHSIDNEYLVIYRNTYTFPSTSKLWVCIATTGFSAKATARLSRTSKFWLWAHGRAEMAIVYICFTPLPSAPSQIMECLSSQSEKVVYFLQEILLRKKYIKQFTLTGDMWAMWVSTTGRQIGSLQVPRLAIRICWRHVLSVLLWLFLSAAASGASSSTC